MHSPFKLRGISPVISGTVFVDVVDVMRNPLITNIPKHAASHAASI